MYQIQVHVIEAKILKTLLASLDGFLVTVGVRAAELCDDENLLSGNSRLSDSLPNFLVITIGHGRVNHSVTLLQCIQY